MADGQRRRKVTNEQIEAFIEEYGQEDEGYMTIAQPGFMTAEMWNEFVEDLQSYMAPNEVKRVVGYSIVFPGIGLL